MIRLHLKLGASNCRWGKTSTVMQQHTIVCGLNHDLRLKANTQKLKANNPIETLEEALEKSHEYG